MKILNWKIERRATVSNTTKMLVPFIAVLIGLGIGAIIIVVIGGNPILGYSSMIYGVLSNPAEIFVKMSPLVYAGVGVAIAYQARIWNIGAEGQLFIGGLCSTVVGIILNTWPIFILLPIVLLAGFIGGALWGLISALLKIQFDASVVITSLLLNEIALLFITFLLQGPLFDPSRQEPESAAIGGGARLPRLIPGTRFHLGIIIGLILVVLAYILLFRTPLGFRIRAIGANPQTATYAGMRVNRTIIIAMLLSGGFAGLAGADLVCALHYRMTLRLSPGYGYTAIVVALLGQLNPLGVALAAFLLGGLENGSQRMSVVTGIPMALAAALQGIIVVVLLVMQVASCYQIRRIYPDDAN